MSDEREELTEFNLTDDDIIAYLRAELRIATDVARINIEERERFVAEAIAKERRAIADRLEATYGLSYADSDKANAIRDIVDELRAKEGE